MQGLIHLGEPLAQAGRHSREARDTRNDLDGKPTIAQIICQVKERREDTWVAQCEHRDVLALRELLGNEPDRLLVHALALPRIARHGKRQANDILALQVHRLRRNVER